MSPDPLPTTDGSSLNVTSGAYRNPWTKLTPATGWSALVLDDWVVTSTSWGTPSRTIENMIWSPTLPDAIAVLASAAVCTAVAVGVVV